MRQEVLTRLMQVWVQSTFSVHFSESWFAIASLSEVTGP